MFGIMVVAAVPFAAGRLGARLAQPRNPACPCPGTPGQEPAGQPIQPQPTPAKPDSERESNMSDPHQFPQNAVQQQWPSEQPRQNQRWASNPYATPPTYPGTAAGPLPLWAPLYGATLPEAVSRFFRKYATFSGRASRSEFWWWALVSGIFSLVLNVVTMVGGTVGATLRPDGTSIPGPVYWIGLILSVIISLAIIVPNLALSVRRLHDANMSGWTYLLGLIPFVGPILLLVFLAQGSKPEGERFDKPTW